MEMRASGKASISGKANLGSGANSLSDLRLDGREVHILTYISIVLLDNDGVPTAAAIAPVPGSMGNGPADNSFDRSSDRTGGINS